MTDELLPCPFCGGEAELWHNSTWDYVARCTSCKARTRQHHDNCVGAIIAWNTRTERTCRMTLDASGDRITSTNGDEIFLFRFTCSECGYKTNHQQAKYCPNCGAKVVS